MTLAPTRPQRTFPFFLPSPSCAGAIAIPLLVVVAQHREVAEFDLPAEELVVPAEPFLLVGKVEMDVERRAVGPVLVEVEDVRVLVADMEVILDAARLGARARDEAFEQRVSPAGRAG